MKTFLSTILETLLKALGPSITTGGIVTETDWASITGALVTLATVGWTIYSRAKERKSAAAKAGADVVSGLNTPLVLCMALALLVLPGCASLTDTQKTAMRETAGKVITALIKAGAQAGLNAIAANNPTYAPYIAPISGSFNVLFQQADDGTPAEQLAAEIRAAIEGSGAPVEARAAITAAVSAGILAATGATVPPAEASKEMGYHTIMAPAQSGSGVSPLAPQPVVYPGTPAAVAGINTASALSAR